jgi:hypothetical protein
MAPSDKSVHQLNQSGLKPAVDGNGGRMAKEHSGEGKKPPPRCKAFLLCDYALIEAVTGKVSVIGIFDNWKFPQFPSSTLPFMAFLQMIDGFGRYTVSGEVHDLQTDQIISQASVAEIAFPERRTKVNLTIHVPPLLLQHAGNYDFVVLADGQEIDRQQFQAIQIPGGPPHAGDPSQKPEKH